jgi:hypothetical protein
VQNGGRAARYVIKDNLTKLTNLGLSTYFSKQKFDTWIAHRTNETKFSVHLQE